MALTAPERPGAQVADRVLLAVIVGPGAWEGPRRVAWATVWERHADVARTAAEGRARALWVGDSGLQAELAEEAVARLQESFTHRAEARRLSPETESFAAFLRTSARNACTDVFREQKVRGRGTKSIDDPTRPMLDIADPREGRVEPHRATHGVLEQLAAHSAAHGLLERLAADPDEGWKQATVLRLFYGEEWPTQEIAAYFQVTERTVYRWKQEGLQKVRQWAESQTIARRSPQRDDTEACEHQGEIDEQSGSIAVEAGLV